MERLTMNKPVSEMADGERFLNACYMDGGKARIRSQDMDMDELAFIIQCGKEINDDAFSDESNREQVEKCYAEQLGWKDYDSSAWFVAFMHQHLKAMARLHERLKAYEDGEESGNVITLPCKEGDTVWTFGEDDTGKAVDITNFQVKEIRVKFHKNGKPYFIINDLEFETDCLGKTLFLSEKAAKEEFLCIHAS